jgi:hypothetical protein
VSRSDGGGGVGVAVVATAFLFHAPGLWMLHRQRLGAGTARRNALAAGLTLAAMAVGHAWGGGGRTAAAGSRSATFQVAAPMCAPSRKPDGARPSGNTRTPTSIAKPSGRGRPSSTVITVVGDACTEIQRDGAASNSNCQP